MILHFLALDTVAAVLLWCLLALRLVGASPSPGALFWTGAGVWLVYIADRWLDSLPGSTESHPGERHRFASRHRGSLAVAWITVWAVAVGSAAVALPGRWLLAGGILACGAVAYLAFIQRLPSVDSDRRFRAGGGVVVALLVAFAANLFPALAGTATAGWKTFIWAGTVFAFFLQTRTTRHWEESLPLPKKWIGGGGCAGALLSLAAGVPSLAVAFVFLAGSLWLVDRIPVAGPQKVALADWMLAASAAAGLGMTATW